MLNSRYLMVFFLCFFILHYLY